MYCFLFFSDLVFLASCLSLIFPCSSSPAVLSLCFVYPLSTRCQQLRRSRRVHPQQVWGPEQEERNQGDLPSLHLCHRHEERAVRFRRRHRRHHQKQPEGLWALLDDKNRKMSWGTSKLITETNWTPLASTPLVTEFSSSFRLLEQFWWPEEVGEEYVLSICTGQPRLLLPRDGARHNFNDCQRP